ncbi:tyrosine integrase [Gordonia phage Octobien14]|uniref:Integrase n=1 Tax=Gordonia phage Octobien14 TaxID=2483673 RepID=A0A3G3MAZ9_9CAUD|nr:tyrosine integrase [Gordonia phage Octobien14]AYR03154.1 tyrosine integrase [Gordonia phage Octobien14]
MPNGIQKRTWADGRPPRYVARVRVGGKERSKSCDTYGEAKKWRDEQLGLKPTGRRSDNKLLGKVVQAWADHAEGSNRVNREHLVANLGDLEYMKLGDVTTDDIREWRKQLVTARPWANNKPLSSSTVGTLTKNLSAVFNDAVAQGQIPRNPVVGARKGAGKVESSQAVDPTGLITVDQVRALVAKAEEPYSTMLSLFAMSGIRPGELGGLRVRSFNPERKELYVTAQSAGEYGVWEWKDMLKTSKAHRTVPLPDDAVALLMLHLEAHPDYAPESPLFRTERDYQWMTPNIGIKFRKTAEEAGVAGHSPKSLRHFYASALIRAGESVTVVQHRLGHSSPMVTLSVYTHLWSDSAETTRAALQGIL